MKTRLEIRPAARAEFDDASDWYKNEGTIIRDEFVAAVGRTVESITDRPLSFPVVFGASVRRATVKEFPYSIFFIHRKNIVIVLSIFQNKRNPMIWKNKNE